MSDLLTLTKARLMTMVLITTFVGFWCGSPENLDWFLLFRTLFGTALVAASAAIFNQYLEADVDRLMHRTAQRPLPAGRMQLSTALGLGVLFGVAGLIYLYGRVSLLAAILALATHVVYVAIYTPLKRRTSWCVLVGAVSGGLPPMLGWAAAHGSVSAGAWVLFGVLFLWQMPHFLALAWMYRDEYAQAGFVMLRRNDLSGLKTALESLIYAIFLLVVTFLPLALHFASPWYAVAAVLCNGGLLWCASQFLMRRCRISARTLFFAS
ncbi:MAG: heme o synthase, partial [Chthoniobacteraceae bacterium]